MAKEIRTSDKQIKLQAKILRCYQTHSVVKYFRNARRCKNCIYADECKQMENYIHAVAIKDIKNIPTTHTAKMMGDLRK